MIQFNSIQLVNFTAFESTTLRYTDGLTLVVGENKDSHTADSNMAGKTSLLVEALLWCLYGEGTKEKSPEGARVQGFKMEDVIRKGSDRCQVVVDMEVDGVPYTATRSLRRNGGSKLEVTGLTAKSIAETKQALVDLLGVDYRTFVQTIVMGQGTRRFSQSKDSDRMQVLEQILGLDIYSDALERVRKAKKDALHTVQGVNGLESDLRSYRSRLELLSENVEKETTHYETSLKALETWRLTRDDELKDHRADLKRDEKELEELEEELETIDAKIQRYIRRLQGAAAAEEKLEEQAKVIQDLRVKDLALVDQLTAFGAVDGDCPTCDQPVEEDYRQSKVEDIRRSRKNVVAELEEASDYWKELNSEVTNIRTYRNRLDNAKVRKDSAEKDVDRCEKTIKGLRETILELENSDPPESVEPDQYSLKKAKLEVREETRKIKATEKSLADREAYLEDLKFWDRAFGDKGIKSLVIGSVVPDLNRIANSYVSRLSAGTEIEFDTQSFTATGQAIEGMVLRIISSGGEGYHFGSGGERRRVDFAVALALQSLLSNMGSRCNLFILDEPFESMDASGVEASVELLREYAREQQVGVYCVTHLDSLKPLFDQVVTVRRENDVAQLAS